LVDEGQRVSLESRVSPGGHVDVNFDMDSPGVPGLYMLEVDLVHETVVWFKDRGSSCLTLDVEAVPITNPEAGSAPTATTQAASANLGSEASSEPVIPRMEMHAVPRRDIEDLVASSEGEIVAVFDDHSAGPEWISYRYVITRLGER